MPKYYKDFQKQAKSFEIYQFYHFTKNPPKHTLEWIMIFSLLQLLVEHRSWIIIRLENQSNLPNPAETLKIVSGSESSVIVQGLIEHQIVLSGFEAIQIRAN